jgi:glycopeptide antibiotics resistance protein
MIENFIVFVPFGLLISISFKRIVLWQKLVFIFFFSLAIETIQFLLAIGISDITDLLMNTLGGLAGLLLYKATEKHIDSTKMNYFINITSLLLIILILVFRIFVLKVKY